MKAGDLRHQAIFEKKTETPDAIGANVEIWSEDFTVPCAYEPIGSREFPTREKRNSETTARFRIRYVQGIDCDRHRIRFALDLDESPVNWQVFNIYPPLPKDGKRFELLIEASEVR